MLTQNNKNSLTDEEVSEASGGAVFNKCPLGHYEATSIANVMGPNSDCRTNKCGWCIVEYIDNYMTESGGTAYKYRFHCECFNRTVTYAYTNRI